MNVRWVGGWLGFDGRNGGASRRPSSIDEDDEKVCAFAYRSTNDFASEPIPYGFRAKPECTLLDSDNIVEVVQAAMIEQREIQGTKPLEQRLYIGGECIFMHLTKDAFTSVKAFRFDDHEEQLDQIFSAF